MTKDKRKIQIGDSALPPAGDARREELLKRTDALEEAAEKLADEQELHAIDPKSMKIERELAQKFDPSVMSMLHVSNRQRGWEYCWANAVNQSGLQVMMKKYDGWMIVSGNDPEAAEHKGVDGSRRIADVILMKIPLEKYKDILRRDELKRQQVEKGVSSQLEEMGRKYRGRGLKVHTPNTESSDLGYSTQQETYDPRKRYIRQEAARQLGDMSKTKIPGVPLPGEGR